MQRCNKNPFVNGRLNSLYILICIKELLILFLSLAYSFPAIMQKYSKILICAIIID